MGKVAHTGGDTGLCAVASDAGRVVHDCDQLRTLCPSGFCDLGCDFTGVCCLVGGNQARCAGGALGFPSIDSAVCSLDASTPTDANGPD